ncbi:cupin [Actinoplanes lobatus]|uniref:Putative cupin superfamily sugar epimerase n=2 Tax=Actinoplanes lobatus TaxID=113568 RepID=A0A7W7MKZ9_9ACTN|nr:cupin domain-containing protein [Actinoplanes lobatus]MBB4753871.1 putative cupin superfamily sugar epimerase [Actinoplanes lobatus]GGN72147.1 cupin [Actinoplanes lobatus]
MDRSEFVEELGLTPHPEGGWYRETWRSPVTFRPEGYDGPRHAATAIYFLLHPGEESAWHVVRSDELWLHHSGGPLLLRFGGSGDRPSETGTEILDGTRPQVLIPAGVWQAAEPAGDEPVLVSCVVAPGFDFADFRML